MAHTKKTGEMTTNATKEIAEKIDSFEEQATQGSFVPNGHVPQHFLPTSGGIAAADPANQGPTRGVHHRKSDTAAHGIIQPDAVPDEISRTCTPTEPLVGPSGPRVSTKGSCVDPSRNDPETGDSDRYGLYIEAYPTHLVALGRVYEGSTVVHNTPLLLGQVKAAVSPAKPPQKPDPKVDDPRYLMTLTIPEIFLRPYQFESESYIKTWMQSSKQDVYLGAYLNGSDNYLKGIINSALKGLNQRLLLGGLSSRYCNRQKGSTECGYYVMHWMFTIILGSFRNNWEAYFNDPRPLEPERLKVLWMQWAQYYLRVRDQTPRI
ncbi:hypothetical protein GmHk_12G035209 [Glycine max]|nr:hypothetical protein GmHk_12G035209 [Glycine max]